MAINFAGKYIMRHIGPGMFANTKERSVVFRMDKAGVILSKQSIFHFVSRDLETFYWTTVLLLEIGTDNKLTYSVSSAYNLGSIVSITFDFLFGAVNNPYHTVITHNGETGVLQLWVNNTLVDTKQLIIRLPRGAVTAVIGHAHDTVITQDGFTGHLADFAGYNRILTEEEIGKDFFGDF